MWGDSFTKLMRQPRYLRPFCAPEFELRWSDVAVKGECGATKFCCPLCVGVAQRRDLHGACHRKPWTEDSVKGLGMVLSKHKGLRSVP